MFWTRIWGVTIFHTHTHTQISCFTSVVNTTDVKMYTFVDQTNEIEGKGTIVVFLIIIGSNETF